MTPKPFEFEKALGELEDITTWFESNTVDLDQGLVKFERGMELANELKTHLASVENRVEKIKQRFSASSAAQQDAVADAALEPTDDTSQTDLFGA